MSRAADYEHWKHESGHRLRADGQQIKYTNQNASLRLRIEGEVQEGDEGGFAYRVWLQDEDNQNVVYPELFYNKQDAFDNLEDLMEQYNSPSF